MAFGLLGDTVASGQQPAEQAISIAIGWIGQNLEVIYGNKAHAREILDLALLRFNIATHYAGKTVAVGDSDRAKAEFICLCDHFLGMRGSPQEGEIGGDGKLR